MKPFTLTLVTLTVQHWMLMLALFAMSSFGVDGWVAMMYTAIAWIVATPVAIFYPVLLRLLALLRQPRLGLLILSAALVCANDWLFREVSAPGISSSDYPVYSGFRGDEGLPIRLCVFGATVLSMVALRLPLTEYLSQQNARQSKAPLRLEEAESAP